MENGYDSSGKPLFKFKELKTYGDTEWVFENNKKYRQVFDKSDTSYVYIEFSFYNKLFDHSNWDFNFTMICHQVEPKAREICKLELTKKISKYDAIVYIREGWGNKKKGTFWKEGKYQWDLIVDGKLIGSRIFFIIENGISYAPSKYIELMDISFYEGALDELNSTTKHTSLIEFSTNHTRYIFCQLHIENKLNKKWPAEFFIKYFNEQGDLKTIIQRSLMLDAKQKTAEISAGFGSNTKGSWSPGRYRVEVLFMNSLIATTNFILGDDFVEGEASIQFTEYDKNKNTTLKKATLNFDAAMLKLDTLIGLDEIKTKVRDHAQYLQFIKLRQQRGFNEEEGIHLHTVFTGNPGTGKTTVAKLMGDIYHSMGLLSKGHVHEVDRVDLIGEFIGQTAPKVKEAINKAKGGVLFIDEAYSLARSPEDHKDFGKEAIEILIKELSGENKDMALIVAGYPKEMKNFLDSNPGLRSRFKHFYEFKDYTPSELMQIADVAAMKMDVQLDANASSIIEEIIIGAYRSRTSTFGNARFVYDLIEKAKINLGIRIMARSKPETLPSNALETIILKDVIPLKLSAKVSLLDLPLDHQLLVEATEELNQMIGMDQVKKQILELIDIVRYHKVTGKSVMSTFYLHTIFIGNPGTGKTTVARIIAKIFKALGILERGHLVETDRQGLVAGFVGQTAIKTSAKIDEAMGGVLFIDEAYSLNNFNGLQGDFGNEAIQTILKRMEDDRGKFFLFVAGYPDNMETFLKANPGLSSRFDKKLVFKDYDAAELFNITKQMMKAEGYTMTKKAKDQLTTHIDQLVITKDKYFGNARTVRLLVTELIAQQNLRLAAMNDPEISPRLITLINEVDVENTIEISKEQVISKRRIGFGQN